MTPAEYDEEILARLLEGEVTPAEAAMIGNRLQTESELRLNYRRMCNFEASAAMLIGGKENVVDFSEKTKRHNKPAIILAIAAAAVALLVAGQLIFGNRSHSPQAVALSFGSAARLADGSALPSKLMPGRTLFLENGSVELSFQEGKALAKVVAPARFFFHEDGALQVERGSFDLELKPGSTPLRCLVGDYLIEDIGTSYSFIAEKGTLKEISVSEGRIRLTSGAGSTPQIVTAGSGLRISPQGYVPFQTVSGQSPEDTFFEWTPATDSGRNAFVSEPGGLIAKTSQSLEFSAKDEFSAWLRLPLDSLLRGGEGYSVEFSATLPSNPTGLLPRHSGISLFKGSRERIFLGKQLHNRVGWVAVLYPENGERNDRRIINLGTSIPGMTFRIRYSATESRLSVESKVGQEWKVLFSEKTAFAPDFDAIRLTAIDSSISLHGLKIRKE